LKAEAVADRGESSIKAAIKSSKGKDKVANPDWEDIPCNLVPITPLSSSPRFSQVTVRSSLKAMAPPRSHIGATTITASVWPPSGGGGRDGGDGRGRGLGGPLGGIALTQAVETKDDFNQFKNFRDSEFVCLLQLRGPVVRTPVRHSGIIRMSTI
jgi:hypothetical protein